MRDRLTVAMSSVMLNTGPLNPYGDAIEAGRFDEELPVAARALAFRRLNDN
jgi:hypothetical protein